MDKPEDDAEETEQIALAGVYEPVMSQSCVLARDNSPAVVISIAVNGDLADIQQIGIRSMDVPDLVYMTLKTIQEQGSEWAGKVLERIEELNA